MTTVGDAYHISPECDLRTGREVCSQGMVTNLALYRCLQFWSFRFTSPDSRSRTRHFATTSAEALPSLESAKSRNW
jgi:hypothetical protein